MLHKLIDHSPDLKKLRDEGFEVRIKGAHILVQNVPYLNSYKEICFGTLVSDLTIAGDRAGIPRDHVIYFIGEQPCHKNGSVITALIHGQNKTIIGDEIEIDRSFSNKPMNGYTDYYEKFTTYITIVSGPAQSINNTVKAQTYRLVESENLDSILNYPDTNSSRAQITSLTEKLKFQKVGIIGMGGTGSYILDFVAKTPVKEIHIFDKDEFLLHNAFRAPGAPTIDALKDVKSKVDYFGELYSRMHRGIKSYNEFLDDSNLYKLDSLNFVFICVDNGPTKKQIIQHLTILKIDFIDVGIGVEASPNGSLLGMVRVTSSSNGNSEHIFNKARISFANTNEMDLYKQNIQIAELNALNACLAIIKWKKMSGIFYDAEKEQHSLFSIEDNSIINDDIKT